MVAELSNKIRHTFDDSINRQHTADDAGGPDEDLVCGYSDVSRKQPCGFLCGSQSLGAGTSVRVTAVDENGPSNSLTQMQTIKNNRRRDHLIFRENARDGTTLL